MMIFLGGGRGCKHRNYKFSIIIIIIYCAQLPALRNTTSPTIVQCRMGTYNFKWGPNYHSRYSRYSNINCGRRDVTISDDDGNNWSWGIEKNTWWNALLGRCKFLLKQFWASKGGGGTWATCPHPVKNEKLKWRSWSRALPCRKSLIDGQHDGDLQSEPD